MLSVVRASWLTLIDHKEIFKTGSTMGSNLTLLLELSFNFSNRAGLEDYRKNMALSLLRASTSMLLHMTTFGEKS